jgi:hypothetical protein
MDEMHTYLDNVCKGRMPANPQIMYNIQNIFNLCPNLSRQDLVTAKQLPGEYPRLCVCVSR